MKKSDLKFMPQFYDRYINLIPDNLSLIDGLKATKNDYHDLKNILEKHQDYRYETGKWSPKDILQHVIDCERIQSYRALAFARNEQNAVLGFNQNEYAKNTDASNRSIEDLLKEFKNVRESSIFLFESFTKQMLLNEGICSNVKVTPLAFGLVNIGHAKHHLTVLQERYFK